MEGMVDKRFITVFVAGSLLLGGCVSQFEHIKEADLDARYPWTKPWVEKIYTRTKAPVLTNFQESIIREGWEKDKLVKVIEYLNRNPEVGYSIKENLLKLKVV